MKTKNPEERLKDRLFGLGPKRMLVVAGDGLRGVVSTGLLSDLEVRLARRAGRRSLRLADYFDVIAGAGVGGLIAAELAIGRRAAQITETLRQVAPPAAAVRSGVRFDAARLDAAIDDVFADRLLDARGVRTGLALAVLPVGGAVRVISNIPRPPEEAPGPPIALAQAVRATVGGAKINEPRPAQVPGVGETFTDPAMGGAGDPLQMMLEAVTLTPYGVGWPMAPDSLMIVSAGTGSLDIPPPPGAPFLGESRRRALVSIQAMAHAPAPWSVGGELGDMREARLTPFPMLHFVRLDARLEPDWIEGLGLNYTKAEVAGLAHPAPHDEGGLARLHEVGLRSAQALFDHAEDRDKRDKALLPPRFDPKLFADRRFGPPRTRLHALARLFDPPPVDED